MKILICTDLRTWAIQIILFLSIRQKFKQLFSSAMTFDILRMGTLLFFPSLFTLIIIQNQVYIMYTFFLYTTLNLTFLNVSFHYEIFYY